MNDEARDVLKFFFRKWSTIELTEDARMVLRQDVMYTRTLLEIHEVDVGVLDGAEDALDRDWFATKYHDV